jgi:Zn-dependent protease with chaperone function
MIRKALPAVLIAAGLGAAFLLSRRAGPSRESLLPLSRTVAEHEKAVDRAAGAAFPLSADEERRIGEGLDRELGAGAARGIPDPAAAVRAARWRELGGTAARSPLVSRFRGRYEFRTIGEGGANAFALPGGFIYATEPLLQRLGADDDALLFVLGHEIGHVELGHCADAYRLRPDGSNPIRDVLGGVLSVGRLFAAIHFSSAQELEADAFAVRLVRGLGRDPRAGLRVLDALGDHADSRTKRDPGEVAAEGVSDYFRTHPGAWERRAALEREIAAGR